MSCSLTPGPDTFSTDRLRLVVESARRLAIGDEIPHSAPYLQPKGKHDDQVKEKRLLIELRNCVKETSGHFERLGAQLALHFLSSSYCRTLQLKVKRVRKSHLLQRSAYTPRDIRKSSMYKLSCAFGKTQKSRFS